MSNRKKIILVEDNPDDVRLTKLALENLAIPADLVHCGNGEQLLYYLKTEPLTNICYILLDLNMPKMNGFDVLKIFHDDEELRRLPIIVFTTSSSPKDIQTCYELGANAYVVKPLNFVDLENSLNAISGFWGDINVKPMFKK